MDPSQFVTFENVSAEGLNRQLDEYFAEMGSGVVREIAFAVDPAVEGEPRLLVALVRYDTDETALARERDQLAADAGPSVKVQLTTLGIAAGSTLALAPPLDQLVDIAHERLAADAGPSDEDDRCLNAVANAGISLGLADIDDPDLSRRESRLADAKTALSARLREYREALPDDLRAQGWVVAVHNDYRLNGVPHTFWLFTRGDEAIKGEGRTDAEALTAARARALSRRPK